MTEEQPASPPPQVRTRVARRIAADPTSAALLLAGPEAVRLWPGDLGTAAVRAVPPARQASSYVSRFSWSGDGLPDTEGTVTLAAVGGLPVMTHAVLVLHTAGERVDELGLRRAASGFLANLAAAAEARSQAA